MLLEASLIFLNRVNSSSDIYFLGFLYFFDFAFYCIVGQKKLVFYFFNWSKAQWNHINFSSWLIYCQTAWIVLNVENIYFLSSVHCKLPAFMLLCSRACSAVSFRRSILTHDIFLYIFIYMNTYTGSICIHVYIFMYVPHKNVFFYFDIIRFCSSACDILLRSIHLLVSISVKFLS